MTIIIIVTVIKHIEQPRCALKLPAGGLCPQPAEEGARGRAGCGAGTGTAADAERQRNRDRQRDGTTRAADIGTDGHRDPRPAGFADSPARQPDSRAEGGPAELPAPTGRAAAIRTVCHDMAKHK